MFQPETEDMLPRMAPKPSATVPLESSDRIAKPQVPEVSILFGQQEDNGEQQQRVQLENKSRPTYEAWKKQMLPKVTFPPTIAHGVEVGGKKNINLHICGASRADLYPFRSSDSVICTMNRTIPSSNSPTMLRRSLESCNAHTDCPQLPSQQSSPQSFPSAISTKDVLMKCAGTQTGKISDLSNLNYVQWANVATKEDIGDVHQMLKEMRQEQQVILNILEAFVNRLTKPETRDAAVQYECIESDNKIHANGILSISEDEVQTTSKDNCLQRFKPTSKVVQTPKGKPIAQSTAYRPNSPHLQLLQNDAREVYPVLTSQYDGSKPVIVPKSASDTSLVMNELALKYLPNEKLAELLNELNIDYRLEAASIVPQDIPTSSKLNENNFKKGPSDISKASYKYLKKYRLLSDAHEENYNTNDNPENENHMPSYNLPRNANDNQRQTPNNKNSPYTGLLPLSPLARPPTPLTAIPPHIVNLENIKTQPKFL